MGQLKQRLCSAPCLAYPDPKKEFYLDAGFSNHCLSAGLYQLHDKDKRVVAYASKNAASSPECKYSNCEKALLCTVWAIQRFSNYIGAQRSHHRDLSSAGHLPKQSTHQRWHGDQRTHSYLLMTFQGRELRGKICPKLQILTWKRLAVCQNCSTDTLHTPAEPKEPPQPQLTNHRYFEENVCEGMPTAYVNGCSYNHKGTLQAGAGVVWLNNDPCPPQQFNLGPRSSQYAEIAAILITLQMAASHTSKNSSSEPIRTTPV